MSCICNQLKIHNHPHKFENKKLGQTYYIFFNLYVCCFKTKQFHQNRETSSLSKKKQQIRKFKYITIVRYRIVSFRNLVAKWNNGLFL